MTKILLMSFIYFLSHYGQAIDKIPMQASFKDSAQSVQESKNILDTKSNNQEIAFLKIGKNNFKLFLAQSDEEKRLGLSKRKSMPKDFGMLFSYQTKSIRPFWMKDMEFPLDFLWIDENKIIQINENISINNLPPPEDIRTIKPIDKVIELNAGTCKEFGIKVGDNIEIIYD